MALDGAEARPQRRCENRRDTGAAGGTVQRPVEDHRCGQPGVPEGPGDCRRLPMAVRHRCPAVRSLCCPAVTSGPLGRSSGLVDDDEALGRRRRLGHEPGQPSLPDVRSLLRATNRPCRLCRCAAISANVLSGVSLISARIAVACASGRYACSSPRRGGTSRPRPTPGRGDAAQRNAQEPSRLASSTSPDLESRTGTNGDLERFHGLRKHSRPEAAFRSSTAT